MRLCIEMLCKSSSSEDIKLFVLNLGVAQRMRTESVITLSNVLGLFDF